jgi:small-conductance mechanosensitive channel
MNVLQSVFCSQYLELSKKGKGEAAYKNGLVLCAVCIGLNLMTILFILISFDLNPLSGIDKLFGSMSGRTAGRIIALVLFSSLFIILRYLFLTKDWFNGTVTRFDQLEDQQKKKIVFRAIIYLVASMVVFFASIFVMSRS